MPDGQKYYRENDPQTSSRLYPKTESYREELICIAEADLSIEEI
jgi:hypothetical protein